MRSAGGATAATAAVAGAATPASAQEAVPDFGPYLDDARLYDDDVTDMRGEEEVTVAVGAGDDGVAFDPPTIWIDPETTVVWEWTGEGGGHNVMPEEGPAGFEHPDIISDPGAHYEYTFTEEDAGITTYKCEPHEPQGMKGGIAVGDDVETISPAAAEVKEPNEFGVDIHEHWVGTSVILMLIVTLLYTFFALKYGESAHTSGGN